MFKKEQIKYLGFDDRWYVILGIPFLAFFIPFAFFDYNWFLGENFNIHKFFETFVRAGVYWIGFRTFLIYIRRKYEDFQFAVKRIIKQIIFILWYGFVMSFVISFIFWLFCNDNNAPEVSTAEGFTATYLISFFILTIYEAVYLYDQNKKNIIETERLKREHVRSELQGLRNQVNPHFLFNSMNTLMNIIQEDKQLATSFLKKLSDVYRYILEKREENLIPLKDELKFIESYVFLQKERFRNNLNVNIEISEHHGQYFVLPLCLQILFENAIKHNIISSKHPLTINAFVDHQNNLVIENNFQPKNQSEDSTGVGLENISSRLTYFSDKKLEIEDGPDQFIVRVPLVHPEENRLKK